MDNKLPKHIAIIMDGNGRWAAAKGMPRNMGHKKGADVLLKTVQYSIDMNIKYLTVYAFSTENWKRPKEEVNYLMELPFQFLSKIEKKFDKQNIKVKLIGYRENLPLKLVNKINEIETKTKDNTGLIFSIAFNYGSQDEIISAVNYLVDNKINVSKEDFPQYLMSRDLPDVDLLIRTSNELRISNFLLWQIAYSELYFIDTLWPDFSKKDFTNAVESYISRDRRFGGLK